MWFVADYNAHNTRDKRCKMYTDISFNGLALIMSDRAQPITSCMCVCVCDASQATVNADDWETFPHPFASVRNFSISFLEMLYNELNSLHDPNQILSEPNTNMHTYTHARVIIMNVALMFKKVWKCMSENEERRARYAP